MFFFVLYTLWRLLWSITEHTHRKCNLLFYTIKIKKKKKNKSADVIWRGFDAICVSLDHGQQPIKMHTEVTLLCIQFIKSRYKRAIGPMVYLCGDDQTDKGFLNLQNLQRYIQQPPCQPWAHQRSVRDTELSRCSLTLETSNWPEIIEKIYLLYSICGVSSKSPNFEWVL